MDASHSIAR